ncbi:YMGG-like glycine zipper-containing protein [Hyphococcus sp.]|uniref:YMGG-like glycine zipper-containing protein n=1 Tax=Hyphococcus sp. TaxID=2038636 RepID=UPI003CCC0980
MRKGVLIGAGVGALVAVIGVGAAMSGAFDDDGFTSANENEIANETENVASAPEAAKDCRAIATAETGFDPATTPVPVRDDAGNKQVLKGTAVGAAVGAVAGEVIGDKAGYGAAAGAAAGAAGGQAVKADKQKTADEVFEQQRAQYEQAKVAYDTALQVCLND